MGNNITLAFAFQVRQSILDALEWYTENVDKIGIKTFGEDKFAPTKKGMMRASEFSEDKCPKLASAQSLGLVPKNFTTEQLNWFVDARYIAMKAKVAISEFNKASPNWTVLAELPGQRLALTCTTDIMLEYRNLDEENFGLGDYESFPIEIKWTSHLQKYAVEQLIANMWVNYAKYGFVLTLPNHFGGKADVWVVHRNLDSWTIVPTVGQNIPDDFPIYYGDEWFQKVYDDRLAWEIHETANLDGPGPFTNPLHKQCADTLVPYEVYQRNSKYGRAGEAKKNSGYTTGLCPLYGKCHKAALEHRGIPTNPVPRLLHLELDSSSLETFQEWSTEE